MAARRLLLNTMKQICLCAAASFAVRPCPPSPVPFGPVLQGKLCHPHPTWTPSIPIPRTHHGLLLASLQSQDWTKNDEKLLQAVDYNDAGRVTSLLVRKGLVPTKLDSEGKSAFHLAAMRGNVDCLEAMLAHGVDAMTKDSSGYTALHLASKHGHPQCVSKLLQASCPVDVVDGSGRTALHHAGEWGQCQPRPAHVPMGDSAQPLSFSPAVSGCISCSEILCDFKAPLNIKDKDGSTPLILAAKMSHSELCRYLLHRGAAVNSRDLQGRTALMLACENGSVETVEVLVNAGARVAVVDSTGHDAAHYSLATGNALIQHFLQEATQRRSWASEEESTEQTSQTSSPSQSSVREKNSTPRKRKAPLPPLGTPSQEDRDAYEEIVRLRQERAQFLQKIRGLEQQEKQRRERAELDEGSLRSMEKQIQELEERLAVRDGEKERLGKEVEALWSRLSSLENEKENTSYDIETLQDEEGDPLEFPGRPLPASQDPCRAGQPSGRWHPAAGSGDVGGHGTGVPAPRRGRAAALQEDAEPLGRGAAGHAAGAGAVPHRAEQGAEGENTGKSPSVCLSLPASVPWPPVASPFSRQVLENYERDESNPSTAGDFVPASLYNALQRELERLRAQRLESPRGTDARDEAGGRPDGQTGASEQAPEQIGEGSAAQQLAEEPAWTWGECKAALGELQAPRTQTSSSAAEREAGAELAEARAALRQAQAALEEREQRVKELQARLEAGAEAVEATASLGASLEEASREKEALLERCGRAEAEAEALRRELEAKARDWRAAGGPELEPGVLEQRVAELVRQQEEVTAQLGQLRETLGRREAELGTLREQLAARPVGRREHEEALARLRQAQAEMESRVPREEHARATAALEKEAQALRERAAELEAAAEAKGREAARLEAELAAAVPRGEHEAAQAGLRAEAAALTQRLGELSRRHEKTCEEVFRVQRQALFMKSERQAAEERLAAAQKQLAEAQDEARRLRELHGHAEDSARLVKDRDRKVGDREEGLGVGEGLLGGETVAWALLR
ncbi:hypothetical protein QYF61_017077 [Mycteria americana]|uniref:Ankyrin repeat domain-containing protein 24 n=1 Tax=Mycteria americana TaxID=33587 RepID=A0AAN7N3K5_MYCAM|nr:hypothetical protein QYF61_017077 [Mycteria americana]